MTDNQPRILLVTVDAELADAAEAARPAAISLQLSTPAAVTSQPLKRPHQLWVDLDCAPNGITAFRGVPRIYFYSSRIQSRPDTGGLFVAKSAVKTALAVLWSAAEFECCGPSGAAEDRAEFAREAERDLPGWALDLHELDLREFCRRCTLVLPQKLGYRSAAIYLHHADRQLLTLANASTGATFDLAIRVGPGSTHPLARAADAGPGRAILNYANTSAGAPGAGDEECCVARLMCGNKLEGLIVLQGAQATNGATAEAIPAEVCEFLGSVLNHARRYEAACAEARLDCLTGLHNQRWMLEALAREMQRSQRYGDPLSIIVFDLDGLKPVNDRHGHVAGDAVLRHVAARISSVLRQTDAAARTGGDEFVVTLPSTDLAGAQMVAERVVRAVQVDEATIAGCPIPIGISAGVAEWQRGWDATTFLHAADQAMYSAKRAGRNRVMPAAPEIALPGEAVAPPAKIVVGS